MGVYLAKDRHGLGLHLLPALRDGHGAIRRLEDLRCEARHRDVPDQALTGDPMIKKIKDRFAYRTWGRRVLKQPQP